MLDYRIAEVDMIYATLRNVVVHSSLALWADALEYYYCYICLTIAQ